VASAGHVQVCTSLQTDNHTSTSPLSFLQAGCPSCRQTNSVKALKARSLTDENKLKRQGRLVLKESEESWFIPAECTGWKNTEDNEWAVNEESSLK